MLETGLYEQLINKLILSKLESINRNEYFIKETVLDKQEASVFLSRYLGEIIKMALATLPGENSVEQQVALCNKVILFLNTELNATLFEDDLIISQGKVLSAVLSKLEFEFADIESRLKEMTPYTRFSQSELFTGGTNLRISLDSEIRKEILSSDQICFLVSFIKFAGIRVFQRELREFTDRGGQLKVITTSYMGATDPKAIEFLSSLKNTEVRVSYNTQSERLHAKAYLFLRNTGFHTGYVGSSNLSRAAVTSGLEWNLKVTTKEVPHIIDKFKKTFDSYWLEKSFELYVHEIDKDKLVQSINAQKQRTTQQVAFFDLTPFHYQKEILDKIDAERVIHGRKRNLIVAATGTGKTIIAAFDYRRFVAKKSKARLLFVAHRKEILVQAMHSFRGVLKDNNFGELWCDGIVPSTYDFVFASIATLNSQYEKRPFPKDYYSYIVIDEVHHMTADSYRPLLNWFDPEILLGLTATPERMDGGDILNDFHGVVAAEIRLPEALNKQLLCPFQYFGISDSIDLSNVSWENGRYAQSELTRLYVNNTRRVSEILSNLDKYLTDPRNVRCLAFCVSQEHASYMAEKFNDAGLSADYLTSQNNDRRDELRRKLSSKGINYLFVVDIFNEGVDIPEVDTVLFLRPTESLTVFLQQLGRGLRKSEGKEVLTVLDFVGNARPEYDFEKKFRALIGKSNNSTEREIIDDFPHLPVGCSIVLEKKAREYILANILNATSPNRKKLISKIRNFRSTSDRPLTLNNFLEFYNLTPQVIYRRGTWSRLLHEAGMLPEFSNVNEAEVGAAISRKWLSCNSASYLRFVLELAEQNFNINVDSLDQARRLMCLMLYYDLWQAPGAFRNLNDAIRSIGANANLVTEIKEVLGFLLNRIDFIEKDFDAGYVLPLKVYSRYTRDQILSAFEVHTLEVRSSSREGVLNIKSKNTELLFITLEKSEADYSPTTLYDDYAINDTLFHWQSQNSARPDVGAGLSYVNQSELGKTILLFVRERNKDEFGNTMGYVFLGDAKYVRHGGSKPMNVTWELREPIPSYIWKDSAKMADD